MDELKFVGGNGNSIKLDYSRGFLGAEIQIDWDEVICLMRNLLKSDTGLQSLCLYDDAIEEIQAVLNYLNSSD